MCAIDSESATFAITSLVMPEQRCPHVSAITVPRGASKPLSNCFERSDQTTFVIDAHGTQLRSICDGESDCSRLKICVKWASCSPRKTRNKKQRGGEWKTST